MTALLAFTATSAQAVESPEGSPGGETGSYTPDDGVSPSLAGSTVGSTCESDVPWISYAMTLSDPDGMLAGRSAVLTMTLTAPDGRAEEIALGEVATGALSGRVLWPGVSIDASGTRTGWPGYALQGGTWVSVGEDNFGWTRDGVIATLAVRVLAGAASPEPGAVDPGTEIAAEIAAPLSYPPPTASCADPPEGATTGSGEGPGAMIAVTGEGAPIILIASAGVLLALGLWLWLRRPRTPNTTER